MGPLVKEWKPISIPAEDIQGQIRNQKIRKLAVKFDPAWNDELAQAAHDTRVARFSTPLAFMLRVFLDVSHQQTYMRKLMVIDDISQWKSLMPRGSPVRAFDCDHEYIEVLPIASGGREVLVSNSPMDIFVDHLNLLFVAKLQRICNMEQDDRQGYPQSDSGEARPRPAPPWDLAYTTSTHVRRNGLGRNAVSK
ncbi:hypothetical protein H9L39_15380 [Fusarium oxysporum f. sp. albedinis]|nr:hypothetical protein H9L39_15380 [Fusarium oxysporum f. sp. albedinis]